MRLQPRPTILSLAAVMVLAACASTASSAPSGSASPTVSSGASDSAAALRPIKLLLGYRPDVQFAPFYVAQQEGYFADAGLDVTIEHADAGELIRLVADGQAEFGVADATDVMIARTSAIPVTYISTLYQSFPVAVIGAADSVPTDPADLAGHAIGTPGRFGSSWIALLAMLSVGGLTADDVTIREYPQFNQVDGLLAGDVDLITGFRNNEPLRLEAEGMATDQLLVDEIAPLPGPGLVAGDQLIESDPSMASDLAGAIVRAQQAIEADPQLGVEAAIAAVPTIAEDPDTARAVLEATIPIWNGGIPMGYGYIYPDVWAAGYDTLRDLGFIDGSAPIEEMYWEAFQPIP